MEQINVLVAIVGGILGATLTTLSIVGMVFGLWGDLLMIRRLNGKYVSKETREADLKLAEEQLRSMERLHNALLAELDRRLGRMEATIDEIRTAIFDQAGHQPR